MLQFNDNWDREYYQRNYIQEVLKFYPDNDLILISDLDEIPRSDSIKIAYNTIQKEKIIKFKQSFYYYYLNGLISNEEWKGTTLCYKSLLNYLTPHEIRIDGNVTSYIENAGWHFSYIGGVERIRQKIQAYSHQEYNKEWFTDSGNLKRAIETGSNLFSGNRNYVTFVPIDNTYPQYIQDNQDKFNHLIHSVTNEIKFKIKLYNGYEIEITDKDNNLMNVLNKLKNYNLTIL